MGSEPDRLLRAESPAAKRIELREAVNSGSALQLRALPNGLEIPPGASIQLRWESYHLMFIDLATPFKPDRPLEALLHFKNAGPVTVQFDIKSRSSY